MKSLQIIRRAVIFFFAAHTAMVGLILFMTSPLPSSGQDSTLATPPGQSSSQSSPSALPAIPLDSSVALLHLNQAISWYRHSTTGVQTGGLPTDAIYQDNTQSLSAEAVRLAFQSARVSEAFSPMYPSSHERGGWISKITTQYSRPSQGRN